MATSVQKTMLLPCYTPADFAFWRGEAAGMDGYERWHRAARRELTRHLAAGHTVELVPIRRHQFQAWLAARKMRDGREARLDYVVASAGAPRRKIRLRTGCAASPSDLVS